MLISNCEFSILKLNIVPLYQWRFQTWGGKFDLIWNDVTCYTFLGRQICVTSCEEYKVIYKSKLSEGEAETQDLSLKSSSKNTKLQSDRKKVI